MHRRDLKKMVPKPINFPPPSMPSRNDASPVQSHGQSSGSEMHQRSVSSALEGGSVHQSHGLGYPRRAQNCELHIKAQMASGASGMKSKSLEKYSSHIIAL
eukprot:CAMPEP_0174353028 /NCGR_PEP_ID=MMETSP0811_2-20130205/13514_1 /TAXON_ID=73025 ORGANISM="Eutreptiella gymnastica-like, Strain CCMP1594" /NCGR_SAMPLE_ID=MMETSP0811_2 /ASSEMBLY_ACC=CAM_ASM_000667 /LENGTH=100 /DNA_ID=CAMNT_0015483379 /DNA_START=114 /DNA_END=416 /DNA_ORIENTATION=-